MMTEKQKKYLRNWKKIHKDEQDAWYSRYRQKNRKRIRKYDKAWRRKHRSEINAKGRAWYKKHKQRIRSEYRMTHPLPIRLTDGQRVYRYGITRGQFEAMRKEQKDLCAICHKPQGWKYRKGHASRLRAMNLAIDHNHQTKQVRALLCHRCNLCVGWVEKSPELVPEVLRYLKRFDSLTTRQANDPTIIRSGVYDA